MRLILIAGACLALCACGKFGGPDSAGACIGAAPGSAAAADRQIADCTRLIGDGSSQDSAQADVYSSRAAAYGYKHDYAKAIDDYTMALHLRPNDPKTLLNRGIAYHHARDPANAMADYDQILKLNPKSAEAFLNRGLAQDQSGHSDLAVRDYDQAITLNPRYADAYINRGAMKDMRDDYKGALADYDQAIALDPKNPLPHTDKGVAYLNTGHLDDALRELDASIALKPGAYAHIARGHVHFARNEIEQAIADYTAAVQLEPENIEAFNDRAISRDRVGDREGAAADRATMKKLEAQL